MGLEMDHLTSRITFQRDSSHKCQFYTKVYSPPGLISQIWGISKQNIKMKYLICQVPVKKTKTSCKPKSLFQKYRKTSQKVNLSNTAVLKLWNFSGWYHFRLQVLASHSEWRVLTKVLKDKWFQVLLKPSW